jgi:hypothetical protein
MLSFENIPVTYPGSLSNVFVPTGTHLKQCCGSGSGYGGYVLVGLLDPDPDSYDLPKIEGNLFEKCQYFILFNAYCLFDNIGFLIATKCLGWIRIQIWPDS